MRNHHLGYLILRITLGLNIFFHGAIRLGAAYPNFVNSTAQLFAGSILPMPLVDAFARFIPIAEALVGALLLLGLFTRFAILAGSGVMAALIAGMCLLQKWEIVGLQMAYVPFYAFLMYRLQDNALALDNLMGLRRLAKEIQIDSQ